MTKTIIATALLATTLSATAEDLDELWDQMAATSWGQCFAEYQGGGNCTICRVDGKTVEDICGPKPAKYRRLEARFFKLVDEGTAQAVAKSAAEQAKRDEITVTIGSPEADVIAKFGQPQEINRTVTQWGVSKQMVYEGVYIYTDNGIVTSWQDQYPRVPPVQLTGGED